MNGQSKDCMNCSDESQADNTFALQAEQIPTLPGNLMELPSGGLRRIWKVFHIVSVGGQGALASQDSVTFLLLCVINPLFPYCSICALSGLFSMFSPVWIVNTMSTLSAAV